MTVNLDTSLLVTGSTFQICAAKTEETMPRHYRLAKKPDGSVILQGAFFYTKGWSEGGFEWREVPMVELEE